MAVNRTNYRIMLGICVEASHQRGMGHLFRVLNLCEVLIERSMPFRIFVNYQEVSKALLRQRNLPFDQVDLALQQHGWQQEIIRKHDIKLWIDDRLNTHVEHATQVKHCGIPLVTFDDRGSGAALADLNVMALALDDSEVLKGNKVLRGPRYLILNCEIDRYRRVRKAIGSIVVTLGGSDTYGVTMKVVRMLKDAKRTATVIIGPAFGHEAELRRLLGNGFILKKNVPSLIEEFSHHDLAITGGGITPFEANASGLPCIVIANEDFEIPVGKGLANWGGAVFAGYHTEINEKLLGAELPIRQMSEAAMARIDLQGVFRVVDEIEALL